MCGIVGYIGPRNATPIILSGLKRLEYRGYDSAGVAVLSEGRIDVRKDAGKLSQLIELLEKDPLAGTPGIEVDTDFCGGLRLMERLIGFDRAVIVDAICSGSRPSGSVLRLQPDDLPTLHTGSSHDVSLPTALRTTSVTTMMRKMIQNWYLRVT